MSQDLPPPPYQSVMIDERTGGIVTSVWSDWFRKAFVRMGGSIAPTNNDPITTTRIQDQAVTAAKIANSTITGTQVAASLAGSGLAGGAGSALSVSVDNSTVDVNGSGKLEAKDGGITFAKLLSTDWTASKATNGYQKLGSGLYLQWGSVGGTASAGTASVSFPVAFPTACLQVLACISGNSTEVTTTTGHVGVGGASTSGFSIYNRTSVSQTFNWIAVGY